MKGKHPRGQLVIVGGAEEKQGDPEILREFVRLAKGEEARIAVITVATTEPKEAGERYTKAFNELGVKDMRVIGVESREQAHDPESLKAIEQATGIFFTGGDQLRITTLLGGTPMDTLLHQCYEQGTILGGTSSGASMMSCTMMISGQGEENPSLDAVELSPGMKFIEGPIIDQHFSQRGRIGRLLAAVARQPQKLGIGIDENTAMVVNNGQFTVLGEGAVTVVDAKGMAYTNIHASSDGEGLALFGLQLHVLPASHCFDLDRRAPLVPDAVPPSEGGER
jgi:cyanophycinase